MKRSAAHSDPDAIVDALDRLREELAVIRDVLDEIRSELQWANQNGGESGVAAWSARRITSMPLDPAAPDWTERLNRFSAAEMSAENSAPPTAEQGQLF